MYTNPTTTYPHANPEQRELFFDNYCSINQIALIQLGNDSLSDETVHKTVQLVCFIFHQAGRVTLGGLFILNGLINCVEARISPYINDFIDMVTYGVSGQQIDDMGCRLSSGIISDLATAVQIDIAAYLDKICNCLLGVLGGDNMPPDSKLVAIEALGNVCLATEYHFHQYLNQVMDCFKSASICSMGSASDED